MLHSYLAVTGRIEYPRGVLLYEGLTGTYGPIGYGFFRLFCLEQGIFTWISLLNRISIYANLATTRTFTSSSFNSAVTSVDFNIADIDANLLNSRLITLQQMSLRGVQAARPNLPTRDSVEYPLLPELNTTKTVC